MQGRNYGAQVTFDINRKDERILEVDDDIMKDDVIHEILGGDDNLIVEQD